MTTTKLSIMLLVLALCDLIRSDHEELHSCPSSSQELCSKESNHKSDLLKIYIAGPLFNDHERQAMLELAIAVEAAGFEVFLPHRDGLLYSELKPIAQELGMSLQEVNELLGKVIFDLDAYQVISSDGIVVNLNGRVPDEGALIEAAIAWSLGNAVVLFKKDLRSVIFGVDNPLVEGLNGFFITDDYDKVVQNLKDQLKDVDKKVPKSSTAFPTKVKDAYLKGEQITNLILSTSDQREILKGLLNIYNR